MVRAIFGFVCVLALAGCETPLQVYERERAGCYAGDQGCEQAAQFKALLREQQIQNGFNSLGAAAAYGAQALTPQRTYVNPPAAFTTCSQQGVFLNCISQ